MRRRDKMISFSFLPIFFRTVFSAVPYCFRYRHGLILQWAILMQIVAPGSKTFVNMAYFAPSHIQEWDFRRLVNAAYWSAKLIVWNLADQAVAAYTPPEDGIGYFVTDGSMKEKRGKKNPLTQKGKKSKNSYYFLGIKFVVVMLQWDVYRIPVDFEIVKPKTDPDYENENKLFRKMFERFTPPAWAHTIIVVGDCAFASKDNMKAIKKRHKADKKCDWFFVFAIAKTWNMTNGKNLKNLATHTPHTCFKRTWIPHLTNPNRRKTFWTFRKIAQLDHIGDVTIVMSKKGRNFGPKKTKMLVTNLPNVSARTVLCIYQRRWQVEILFKELKSGLGLGQQQVTGKPDRVEKAFALGIMAYLTLLITQKEDIEPGKPWSIFQLKHNFILKVVKGQVKHDTILNLKNAQKNNENNGL